MFIFCNILIIPNILKDRFIENYEITKVEQKCHITVFCISETELRDVFVVVG